jgi:predicted enzyme related to lactoylglutathione lyase
VLNEPGALCWTELATRDTKAAEKFYTSLFGWTLKAGTDSGMEYTEFSNKGTPQGGIMAITPQMGNMPAAWTPYFMVGDVDATASKVKELGGRLYMGPADIPKVGRFAVVGDPQGAPFAIFKRAG